MTIQEEYVVFYSEKDQEWTNENGGFHREGGPALIFPSGYKAWYLNGQRHRIGGPAVINSDGSESWYQNDELHRLGGPAVINSDGYKEWYLNEKKVTQEEAER